jgi:hypothetical protein
MIKFKINGKSINYPSAWEDLTFNQFLQILQLKGDSIQLVSILSGLDYEYLKKATIIGLESLLEAARFIQSKAKFELYYPQIGPYKLPANRKGQFDIRFESMGQFEDMRAAMTKANEIGLTQSYARYVAIYLQKIRDKEYDPSKVEEVEEEVKTYRACEVIAMGQFFFLKLYLLSTGIKEISPLTPPSPKKSKQVLMTSKQSSPSMRPSTRSRGK